MDDLVLLGVGMETAAGCKSRSRFLSPRDFLSTAIITPPVGTQIMIIWMERRTIITEEVAEKYPKKKNVYEHFRSTTYV